MHGRYPDFDVLAEADHWDEATRHVVLARLDPPRGASSTRRRRGP
jgi:hypothetical protein